MKSKILGLLAVGLLATSEVRADSIDYTTLGTFASSSLSVGGVTVTGSSDVYVLQLNGLGIVGGASNTFVDGTEFIDFNFSGLGGATGVSVRLPFGGNLDGDNFVGERFLSVFGIGGVSLGTFAQNGPEITSVSSLVGDAVIESFRLQADNDSFRISSLSFIPRSTAVPEPGTLALLGLGLAGLGLSRRRKAN